MANRLRRGRPPRASSSMTKGGGNSNNNNGSVVANERTTATTTAKKKKKEVGRTWIYSINDAANAADDDGDFLAPNRCLGRRIARLPIVRSLHAGYSYFQTDSNSNSSNDDDDDNHVMIHDCDGPADDAAAAGAEEDGTTVAAAAALEAEAEKGEEEGIFYGDNNNNNNSSPANELSFVHVILPPPLERPKTAAAAAAETTTGTDAGIMSVMSYSDFLVPSSSSSSTTTNYSYKYGMNYNTHLPGRNVIARSTSAGGASSDGGGVLDGGGGGYILRMPMTGGTIIGYSPPVEKGGDDDDYDTHNEHDEDEGIIVIRDGDALQQQFLLGDGGDEKNGGRTANAEFPIERQKENVALFRILWDGHTAHSGYVEDLTLPELQSCFAMTPSSSSSPLSPSLLSSSSTTPSKRGQRQKLSQQQQQQQQRLRRQREQRQIDASYAIARHVHATSTRHTLAFEWKIECEILPHLVLVAALELRKEMAMKVRWGLLVERKRKKVGAAAEGGGGGMVTTASTRGSGGKNDEEEIVNQHGDAFGYYSRHPNQYMPSFVPPPVDENEDDDDDDDDDEFVGKKTRKKSITKLTETELPLYHSRLEAECNIPPSKIAERVRQACSMAYDCMMSRGQMDDYYIECERREECERLEREKMMRDIVGRTSGSGSGSSRGSSGMMSDTLSGEVRRSSRPRAVVNYAEDSAVVSSTGHESLGVGGRRRRGGGVGGGGILTNVLLDERSRLPKETSPGGPTALYLLELLKMSPTKEMEEGDNDGAATKEEEEEKDGVDGAKDELDDSDNNDPFFEPNACLLIDQLGRKQRYLSPASIQAAIVRGIEDQIDTPRSLLDEEELEEIANDRRAHKYVTDLVCTTGDKVSDLGQYEPASFARCRFAPHTFLAESEGDDDEYEVDDEDMATLEEIESKERRRELRRIKKKAAVQKRNAELERAYRAKKSFEVWRFRSIHGDGYTMFPLWRDTSRELIKNLCASGVGALDSVVGGAGGLGASTCGSGNDTAVPVLVSAGVSSSSAVVPEVMSDQTIEFPPAATDTQNDEELARVLAAEVDFDLIDGDAPLAKRRRTTRLARLSTAATGGIEQVFYGGSMSMSRDQLLDSVLRLLQQASGSQGGVSGGSSSLMDLKKIIFPESYESRGGLVEMRKLRAALGHLMYKMGKVRRLFVSVEESDGLCWELMRDSGPLVKFVGDNNESIVADSTLKFEGPQSESGECGITAKPIVAHSSSNLANGDANDPNSRATTSTSDTLPPPSAVAPAIDHHLKSQLQSLENYISSLHHAELTLRNSLMTIIDKNSDNSNGHGSLLQISTLAIATASDETEGSPEAEDWKYFLNQEGRATPDGGEAEKIIWSSDANSHVLVGRVIYRPQFPPLRPYAHDYDAQFLNEKCCWYRIVSYTPSIKAADEVTGDGGNLTASGILVAGSVKDSRPSDSAIVERRMRFRAVPVSESDALGSYEHVILTEGQVYAGMEAAMLWQSMRKKKTNPAYRQVDYAAASPHPYRNRYGTRVMLTPRPKVGEDEKSGEVLYGVIAGYDILQNQSAITNKLLVLLDDDNEGSIIEMAEGNLESITKSSGSAFWSTVVEESDGTTFLTNICASSPSNSTDNNITSSSCFCSTYIISLHEFHQGSEAFNVCSSIVSYLKSHPKIGPFLQPVDTVALHLFDYFTVITHPMDVSTLEKNLVDGKYSRVSTSGKQIEGKHGEQEDETDSPVYRMVYNGGFYDDIMLIFDNCIKYNGEQSWIGNEATKLKKNAIKKVEMMVSKAVWQGQGHGIPRGKGSGDGKQFTYADAVSDEDMYEYESDEDEHYGGNGNRQSKSISIKSKDISTKKKQGGKEDIASKAIEQQFMVPDHSHKFGAGGAFPHVKVQTNVGKFTLSQDLWSCRYSHDKASKTNGDKTSDMKGDTVSGKKSHETDDDELLLLLQLQQQEDSSALVRRSTRERHAPQNYAEEDALSSFPSLTTRSTSLIPQSPVSLPGVEYYLVNGDVYNPKKVVSVDDVNNEKSSQSSTIPIVCRSRLGVEGIQELIHESFYSKLYRDHSPNAMILESGLGTYAGGSFPPYLGRVIPSSSSSSELESNCGGCGGTSSSIVWEIREQYLVPALRWIMRGLVRSGHLDEVDSSLSEGALEDAALRSSTSFGSGIVVPNHEYFYNSNENVRRSFDVLDEKEILRKRRHNAAASDGVCGHNMEEKAELSEYEQMRAARVARNADRLKALGLA